MLWPFHMALEVAVAKLDRTTVPRVFVMGCAAVPPSEIVLSAANVFESDSSPGSDGL